MVVDVIKFVWWFGSGGSCVVHSCLPVSLQCFVPCSVVEGRDRAPMLSGDGGGMRVMLLRTFLLAWCARRRGGVRERH